MKRYVQEWKSEIPNWLEIVAKEKTGVRGDWVFCSSERYGDDFLVGLRETRLKKSGPNKGKRMFFGEKVKCVVTREELRKAERRYEEATDNCHNCGGSGLYCWGHSVVEGFLIDECQLCVGTGKAKVAS